MSGFMQGGWTPLELKYKKGLTTDEEDSALAKQKGEREAELERMRHGGVGEHAGMDAMLHDKRLGYELDRVSDHQSFLQNRVDDVVNAKNDAVKSAKKGWKKLKEKPLRAIGGAAKAVGEKVAEQALDMVPGVTPVRNAVGAVRDVHRIHALQDVKSDARHPHEGPAPAGQGRAEQSPMGAAMAENLQTQLGIRAGKRGFKAIAHTVGQAADMAGYGVPAADLATDALADIGEWAAGKVAGRHTGDLRKAAQDPNATDETRTKLVGSSANLTNQMVDYLGPARETKLQGQLDVVRQQHDAGEHTLKPSAAKLYANAERERLRQREALGVLPDQVLPQDAPKVKKEKKKTSTGATATAISGPIPMPPPLPPSPITSPPVPLVASDKSALARLTKARRAVADDKWTEGG